MGIIIQHWRTPPCMFLSLMLDPAKASTRLPMHYATKIEAIVTS